MKRVLILDLDNTIYPVKSIANDMFDFLFELIDEELGATDSQKAEEAKTKPAEEVQPKPLSPIRYQSQEDKHREQISSFMKFHLEKHRAALGEDDKSPTWAEE